jgi:hypothetical protein
VNVTGCIITVVVGEILCHRREMEDIPRTDPVPPKKKRSNSNDNNNNNHNHNHSNGHINNHDMYNAHGDHTLNINDISPSNALLNNGPISSSNSRIDDQRITISMERPRRSSTITNISEHQALLS